MLTVGRTSPYCYVTDSCYCYVDGYFWIKASSQYAAQQRDAGGVACRVPRPSSRDPCATRELFTILRRMCDCASDKGGGAGLLKPHLFIVAHVVPQWLKFELKFDWSKPIECGIAASHRAAMIELWSILAATARYDAVRHAQHVHKLTPTKKTKTRLNTYSIHLVKWIEIKPVSIHFWSIHMWSTFSVNGLKPHQSGLNAH